MISIMNDKMFQLVYSEADNSQDFTVISVCIDKTNFKYIPDTSDQTFHTHPENEI